MRPAPELPPGRRRALVIATGNYQDQTLRQLRAPVRDAAGLTEVLRERLIGGFDVTELNDGTKREIQLAVEEFTTESVPDDLLLVYVSCHGLMDARGNLFFAATDTVKARLLATGLESQWLIRLLDDCRARRQLLVLDCCFSGAILAGAKGPAELDLGRFRRDGRGRAVLTASRATEYSFEGVPLADGEPVGSVFTSALVEGLRTGEADANGDGYVTVDEAYEYALDRLAMIDAKQTPQRAIDGEGSIVLARNVAGLPEPPVDVVPIEAVQRIAAEMVVAPPIAVREAAEVNELATLRAISQTLDDPDKLGAAARTRPVADLVIIVAAVRAAGRHEQGTELLRTAATTRSIDTTLALASALRSAGQPGDAESLLTAAVCLRPVSDVVALAEAVAAHSADDKAGEVGRLLEWAARMRPVAETVELAKRLPTDRTRILLRYAATLQPPDEVAVLLGLLDSTGGSRDMKVVLDAFAERPVADIAALVNALRTGGHDTVADTVLGWVERLPPADVARLVGELQESGAADAQAVVLWASLRAGGEVAAEIVRQLRAGGSDDAADRVLAAADSRDVGYLADLLLGLHRNGRPEDMAAVIRRALGRSREDVVRLAELLQRGGPNAALRDGHPAARLFDHFLGESPPAGLAAVIGELRQLGPQATPAIDGILRRATLRVPMPALVWALTDGGLTHDVPTVLEMTTSWSPIEVVEVRIALIGAGLAPAADKLLQVNAVRSADELAALLRLLDGMSARQAAGTLIDAIEPSRWADPAFAETLSRGLFWGSWRVRAANDRAARERRGPLRNALLSGVILVAAMVLAFPLFCLIAALPQLFARPRLDGGDWVALGATFIVVALLLLVGTGFVYEAASRVLPFDPYAITVLSAIAVAIAGLVLGLTVDSVAHLGFLVRSWLAWNF